MMRNVLSIDNPHLTEEFTIENFNGELVDGMNSLRNTAQLWLSSQIYQAVQQAVDQYRQVVEITGDQVYGLDLGGTFVLCDPLNHVRLANSMAYLMPTNHAGVVDRILMLRKADPTQLLDYHLEAFRPAEGQLGMRLKVLFHLGDTIDGIQYTVNNGYDQT